MEGVGFHTLRLDKRYSTKQFWRFPLLHTFCYITLLFQSRNNAEKHHRGVALQQMNFKEVICIYACFSPKMENCAVLQNFSCQKVLVTWWYAMVWNYSDKMSLECFMILPRDNCMVSCDGFGLLRRLPHMNLDRIVPCCDELI